jgi:hypothetical protein
VKSPQIWNRLRRRTILMSALDALVANRSPFETLEDLNGEATRFQVRLRLRRLRRRRLFRLFRLFRLCRLAASPSSCPSANAVMPITPAMALPSSERRLAGCKARTNASRADIRIVQRRRRFQICGKFTYATTAVPNRNINVRDVIIQFGNTRSSTLAEVTFPGWSGSTTSPSTCQRIGQSLANDIRRNPGDYFVNVRTINPNHRNGAVAARLARR